MPRLAEPLRRLGLRALRRPEGAWSPALDAGTVITLRLAEGEGDVAVDRLVALSGLERPAGLTLVAEVDGQPRAALALAGGELLADPFHPASELGSLLTLRLAQLDANPGAGPDLRCA